jgi:hypothetical protein
MTEQEWLKATDPTPMLEFLRGKASDRKLLMFAVNAVEGTTELCDERLLGLLAVTEQFADGTRSASEVEAHWGRKVYPLRPFAWARALGFRNTEKKRGFKRDQASILVGLVRDIFGPLPFRPITINPAWLTWHGGLLVSMAQRMYDSRDFSDMPVLADAVEEAACQDQDILGHCRSGGEHVRGCWVVDLLLGKK